MLILFLQDYISSNYNILYYKNQHVIGIREKQKGPNGKQGSQILSFGRGTGLSEKELRHWGVMVTWLLDEGASKTEAKDWIDQKMTNFR